MIFEPRDEHLNGYIYDSLTYRYIRAREAMAERDYMESVKSGSPKEKNYFKQQANRDIIRFCEILDEGLGKHD